MPFFVYIIHSLKGDVYYKGFTTNPQNRLFEHNDGQSRFTARLAPWILVFLKEFSDKKSALIYEHKLKRMNRSYLKFLIDSKDNILRKNHSASDPPRPDTP